MTDPSAHARTDPKVQTRGRVARLRRFAAPGAFILMGVLLAAVTAGLSLRFGWLDPHTNGPADASFDIVVTDARTGTPLAGAAVLYEEETGEIDPQYPVVAVTDRAGRARIRCNFPLPKLTGSAPDERKTRIAIARAKFTGTSYVVRASGFDDHRLPVADVFTAMLDGNGIQPVVLQAALDAR